MPATKSASTLPVMEKTLCPVHRVENLNINVAKFKEQLKKKKKTTLLRYGTTAC